ncbi:hypothetical protein JG687_00016546 [Phytophthora cactorum]|uniref:Uncharacterized protein n=1 Tax=Phytophthora cactorum TaxID=29920 RepID=A0A8T1TTU6_9STRA|nr:hypothetical protein PC120_g23660 [Phytophthora cactorum]KAG3068841.1 hypothetical protein PC121_g10048 [Phytophthora cactorum]KAG4040274.1 hypothetical protein PC123_g24183 [Phytophthora cactorum]KAG6946746.1 hypothetical protein JG687_00016546 [Phytophthora cactorum]
MLYPKAPITEDALSSEINKEKPRRGSELRGKQTATRLVRGTLAPVPSVRNIVKLLDNDYSYEEAHRLLPTLTIQDAPMTKKAIAGIYTADECTTDVRFIFPRQFVQKAKTAILEFRKALVVDYADDSVGVSVSSFGIFMLKHINAMNRWHTRMEYLSQTENAINWAVNTSIKRITIPDQLSNGVSSNPKERENAIKNLSLRGGRMTPFGSVPYSSLLTFCGG